MVIVHSYVRLPEGMCFGHELGIVWYPTFDWIAYNRDGHIDWIIMDNVYTGITADSNNKTVRKERTNMKLGRW